MGNGCEVSGKSLSASAESRLKWIRVMGAAVVLLLVAGVMLDSGSRHYAQKAMTPASAFPVSAILGQAPLKSNPVKSKPDARALLSQLPLIFEPNQGQTDPSVKFVSRGVGYSLFLDSTGAVLAMRTAQPASVGRSAASRNGSENAPNMESVRMTLVGSNPAAAIAGSDQLPGREQLLYRQRSQKVAHWAFRNLLAFITRVFIRESIWFSMEARAIWNTTSKLRPAPIRLKRNCSSMVRRNSN